MTHNDEVVAVKGGGFQVDEYVYFYLFAQNFLPNALN